MKIQSIGANYAKYKLNFKSLRTDKNTVSVLKNGTKPIGENQRLNIYSSLQNISKNPDKENINFLLDVADNLAYGVPKNSEFEEKLYQESLSSKNLENVGWSDLLQKTIYLALNDSTETDLNDEQSEFARIFGTKVLMTDIQKDVINLKEKLENQIDKLKTGLNEEDARIADTVKENTAYLVASSEIPFVQKKECLNKFIYLLSDDYKINPQLTDKKIRVADEMLNDMLIMKNDSDILTIKDVNQRQSGICAAISICRKAVAYEDKVRYMDIVMDELSAEPEMTVYDITDLSSKKKVKIKKTDIDYNSALAKGYRIIDASAHNWMQNAHASGDGTIQTEQYTAFDDNSYGIFDDSSWFEGLPEEHAPKKEFLKALIKEKELLSSIDKKRKNLTFEMKNVNSQKKKVIDERSQLNGLLYSTLKDTLGSTASSEEINKLRDSLVEFYNSKSENNELNISSHMPANVKAKIISDHIKSVMPGLSDEQNKKIDENSKKISVLLADSKENDSQIKKLKSYSSVPDVYRMKKRMYSAAAAHRLAVEADVNLPDAVIRYERTLGISPKSERESSYLNNLLSEIKSEEVRKQFKNKDGSVPSEDELRLKIIADMAKLDASFPKELNDTVYSLLGMNLSEITVKLFENVENAVKAGDIDVTGRYSVMAGVENDKPAVLKSINKWKETITNNPSNEILRDAIRVLGYEDEIVLCDFFVSSFFNTIKEGISEETYNELTERFGKNNLDAKLQNVYNGYVKLREERAKISERWNIPTSREAIINKLEKQNAVLSREKLDVLKSRFDEIMSQTIKNESIQNSKERRKANIEAYSSFTEEENGIIDLIDKQFTSMKKYNKSAYNNLNRLMKDVLEEQYSYIGMLNGQFWVREEGSSGLVSNEQVRIMEQMTGKPYHIEYDVRNAVKQIKEGNGSGILSSSVADDEYAFHAQYIPGITSEKFTDPITGKVTTEDILWTDNSWGKSERDSFWNGKDGHLYTDYGSNYGWKNGFITDDSYRIGLPVKDIGRATGYVKKEDDKFALFSDVVLPDAPVSAYQKLYKMYNYILSMDEGKTFFEQLEKQILNGKRINPDKLVKIDELAELRSGNIEKRLEKEITSEEAFNKLPDNDEIKFIFNCISAYFSTENPLLREEITSVETPEELEDLKENMFEEHLDAFANILGKSADNIDTLEQIMLPSMKNTIDEMNKKFGTELTDCIELNSSIFPNDEEFQKLSGSLKSLETFILNKIPEVATERFKTQEEAVYFIKETQKTISNLINEHLRIKSLDDAVLNVKPLSKEFIAAIDKYLEPKNDDELLTLIQQMQDSSTELIQPFFEALTEEDVGINYSPAYDFVHKYKTGSSQVNKAFSEIIASSVLSEYIESSPEDAMVSTADEYFRSLYIKLADMDVQKFIKGYKNEAFEKYKVRQAFPQPVVVPDDEIRSNVNKMFTPLEQSVSVISENDDLIKILNSLDDIHKKYSNRKPFKELLSGNQISIEKNEQFLNDFYADLADFAALVENDNSFDSLYVAINDTVSNLETENGFIGGVRTAKNLSEILSVREDCKRTGINVRKFEKQKEAQLNDLNNTLRLIAYANVEPKYRNDCISKLKNYINLYRKGADDDALNEAYCEFEDFIVKRHITKNPVTLLCETVKALQSGKEATDEYAILKDYLMASLKVAQQTKIQYQLVQNMHEGISTKIKDLLPMFSITLTDGTSCAMDSEQGMLYLVNQLQNVSDNHVTLNLFLSQSGLAKKTLSSLINNFQIKGVYDICDEKYTLISEYLNDFNKLDKLTGQFQNENMSKFKTISEAVEKYVDFIKENTKDSENSVVIYNYLNFFDGIQITENLNSISSSLIDEFMNSLIADALQHISGGINSQLDMLQGTYNLLNEQVNLISAIKVPENSDEDIRRKEFLNEFEKCKSYMTNVITKISAIITENNFD